MLTDTVSPSSTQVGGSHRIVVVAVRRDMEILYSVPLRQPPPARSCATNTYRLQIVLLVEMAMLASRSVVFAMKDFDVPLNNVLGPVVGAIAPRSWIDDYRGDCVLSSTAECSFRSAFSIYLLRSLLTAISFASV